jgi:hypothetical protein
LRQQASGLAEVNDTFGFFDPTSFQVIPQTELEERCESLLGKFPKELNECLYSEMISFRTLFFDVAETGREYQVLDYLEFIVRSRLRDAMSQVEITCRMFLTIPVSTAENERAFSVLRRLKTYLRNTTEDERLSNLALLAIERRTASKLDLDRVTRKHVLTC